MKSSPTYVIGRVFAAALVIAAILFGQFGALSVCRDCGAACNSTQLQIPLLPLTYWTSRTVRETEISSAAGRLNLIGPHDHRWTLIHGSGNGILCALGATDVHRAATSPQVAMLVDATCRWEGEAAARSHLDELLGSEKNCRRLLRVLRELELPREVLSNKVAFHSWQLRAKTVQAELEPYL